MISIGTDLCSVDRIRKKLNSSNKNIFLEKIFTPEEIAIGNNYKDPSSFYAGRWAGKESVAKCLKTGFGESCLWLEICILKTTAGAPFITLKGKTLERAKELKITQWHISISHEKDLAVAFIVAV